MPQQQRAKKKPGRTTKGRPKLRVAETPEATDGDVPQESPPSSTYIVDPARIAAKLQDKNSELNYRITVVEAGFDQMKDEKGELQRQLQAALARIEELDGEQEGSGPKVKDAGD